MKLTKQNLKLFARLSGDYNPVHLHEEYARQTMFGNQIVYGIYQVLLCLEEALKERRAPLFITSLKADFKKPLPVSHNFKISLEKEENTIKASVLDCSLYTKVAISYETYQTAENPLKDGYSEKARLSCSEVSQNFEESIEFNQDLSQILFPFCSRYIHRQNIGVLLASTRIIGMKYPGLNSIFHSLELHFTRAKGQHLNCQILPQDSLFGACEIGLSAPFVNGKLSAFFRPERAEQNNIKILEEKNMQADFSKQRALVIGGSRGIGLQCLRLLSLGGAKTMFTYYKSSKEAAKIVQSLKKRGILTQKLHFNICNQSSSALQKIKEFAPTHLYYFATPKISTDSKTFNEKLFQSFCHYYIFALHQLILMLKPSGLKNVFTPSSIAITDFPKDMMEYAFAKAAMECWGGGNEPR